jgi:hypothetical protein
MIAAVTIAHPMVVHLVATLTFFDVSGHDAMVISMKALHCLNAMVCSVWTKLQIREKKSECL